MRSSRNILSFAAAAGLAMSVIPATPQAAEAQVAGLTILVAPVGVTEPVDRRFGERIANEVRDLLEGVAGYVALERNDVRDLIKQHDLDERAMSPIEWRQLGMQMNASVVMVGSAQQNGSGVEVDISFIDPMTGDELPMSPFTVADDGSHEQAAEQIMTQFGSAVEYARSLAFCADYLGSEQVQDALNNCNKAIELNPESDRAYYLRGRSHMLSESWGLAVEDLGRVVENDGSNTEALQAIAFTHTQLGNSDESLKYYRQYLDFQPNDVAVRLRIAYELSTAGGSAEAVQVLQDGTERAPDDVQLLDYLAGAALQAGQSGGEVTDPDMIRVAVDASARLLSLQGDAVSPTTLSNATSAYMLIEEYDDALAFSQQALETIANSSASTDSEENGEAPQVPKEQLLAGVHSARAQIYDKMDNPEAGVAELEKALQFDPGLLNGRQRLARLKLKSGDVDGAVADFRAAVADGADSDQIANALFGQGFKDHFEAQQQVMQNPGAINTGQVDQAIALFNVAVEFAQAPDVAQQVHFFIGFGYYLKGTAFDSRNEADEVCGPARAALGAFQQVTGHLGAAGQYQANSQASIRDAVEGQLYRQDAIIKTACER